MIRASYKMQSMYPNICDMIYNPAFFIPHNIKMNSAVMNFWNLIGARARMPFKFECEVCKTPMHKRGPRKYMVCQRCLKRYVLDVRYGRRVPVFHVPLVAVET
jgi:hypothetical protein